MGFFRLARFWLLLHCLFLPSNPGSAMAEEKVLLYFFWGEGCPHCASAQRFLEELKGRYPTLEVRAYEVFNDEQGLQKLVGMARDHGTEAQSVPMIFIGDWYLAGFSEEKAKEIETQVKRAAGKPAAESSRFPASERPPLSLPLVGTLETSNLSLPVFTLVIAGLDSFNPCAFFVLLFLLSLLVHAHSRKRMLLIGGIFVLFSGLVYFLYMAAWLNFFILFGNLAAITRVAGSVALLIAVINIKDFFFFKKGISLVIPETSKPRLYERMRTLVHTGSLTGAVAATIVLAVTANTYEVVCTAGFPMIYTRALTLHHLPVPVYYLYLVLYNLIYVVPLACIVAIFIVTLGSRKLSEWEGRVLKLLSGSMMLGLAAVLLTRPSLLNNAVVSVGLLLAALVVTGMLVLVAKRRGLHTEHHEEKKV